MPERPSESGFLLLAVTWTWTEPAEMLRGSRNFMLSHLLHWPVWWARLFDCDFMCSAASHYRRTAGAVWSGRGDKRDIIVVGFGQQARLCTQSYCHYCVSEPSISNILVFYVFVIIFCSLPPPSIVLYLPFSWGSGIPVIHVFKLLSGIFINTTGLVGLCGVVCLLQHLILNMLQHFIIASNCYKWAVAGSVCVCFIFRLW